jgi:hypothetical protein
MIWVVHPVSRSRIRILSFYPSRIPGSKRHRILDPGSGSATPKKTFVYIITKDYLPHVRITDKVPVIPGSSVRYCEFPVSSEKYDLVGRLLKAGEAPVLHTEEEEEEEEERRKYILKYLVANATLFIFLFHKLVLRGAVLRIRIRIRIRIHPKMSWIRNTGEEYILHTVILLGGCNGSVNVKWPGACCIDVIVVRVKVSSIEDLTRVISILI